jgi:CheY-like chemotaxis protein
MSRILVVDDCVDIQPIIRKLLCRVPDSISTFVTDGKSALEMLEHESYELVISDIEMPVMDGFQLLREAKKRFKSTPIMLMAAEGNEQTAMHALNLGAAGHVPKQQLKQNLAETAGRIINSSEINAKRERLLECMNTSECHFTIENDRVLIPTVLSRLQCSLRLFDICDESERLRVRMALDEAVANALYHGNLEIDSELKEDDFAEFYSIADQRRTEEPYSNRKIYITERLSREGARFTIRDEGAGFDVDSIPDPTDPENLMRASGRGIVIMNAFMDEVIYNENGNEVTLVKYRQTSETDANDLSEVENNFAAFV